MVVMVVGLLVVVWNFDLLRVISAKIRVRNAADSAALAAARWQGRTLNMVGDLNLIQAALISVAYADWLDLPKKGRPNFEDYLDAEGYVAEYVDLHELRARLAFVGPLAAFAVAQQAAFNNGAFHDPELAENLALLAEDIRYRVEGSPYDNAFKDYADLLDQLVESGVAVGSYSLSLPNHPLVKEEFYGAIAQATAGWWCGFRDYRALLGDYDGFESWSKLVTEFKYRYMLDLKLGEFIAATASGDLMPGSAMPDLADFKDELQAYLEEDRVIQDSGEPTLVEKGMYEAVDIEWHVFDTSWARRWPSAAHYNDETEGGSRFPIRTNIRPEYDYMGAEAGFGIAAPVGRGILASSGNETVELSYKTKAKAFGFLNTEGGMEPPHYFGFVFPAFHEVRLVHSDIGDKVLEAAFFRHVTEHLAPYLEMGPAACQPRCRYCQLLLEWETLDRQKGLDWLEKAFSDPDENPCEPKDAESDDAWGKAGGGASGGS